MNADAQTSTDLSQPISDFPGTVWMEVTDRKKVVNRYFSALRVYLAGLLARFPEYRNDADDLLQEFIQEKILHPGWLEKADPNKGRFRDLLKSSLRNFVASEMRKREAGKRGGGTATVPLEELEQEIAGPEPVSDSFDIAWLQMLLSETLERMKQGCLVSENGQIWQIFEVRVLKPAFEGGEPPPYEVLVAEFGFKSPAQATNALATAKRMFARHLRTVIAQYETGDKAVRAEIDSLRQFLDKLLPPAPPKKQAKAA